MNEDFWQAYEWFAMSELLEREPYSGGWMEWPAVAVIVMMAFKTERNLERKATDDNGTDPT